MTAVPAAPQRLRPEGRTVEQALLETVPPAYWVVGALLLLAPAYCSTFVLLQILGWGMILGMVALSLMFLAGYGGMVSLVQLTVAGVAGYGVAILGSSAVTAVSLNWPWWLAVPVAILAAVVFGTLVGALAVRTAGIYTIMITLAVSAAFFYFVQQNYAIFNGFTGFNNLQPPHVFGVDWRGPTAFYYLILFWAAAAYGAVLYVSRAPFGLTLQGVRDNPRRMAALGFDVTAHRVAAYAFASLIAAVGGVLLTWLNAQIVPGTVAVGPAIDILIIAVVGGIGHPVGAFLGALLYVILRTFALDILVAVGLSGERFELLIGLGFLVIVFGSPDGLLGIWAALRSRSGRNLLAPRTRTP